MDKPVPTISYDNQLFKHAFDNDSCLTPNGTLLNTENIEFATARGSRAVKAGENNGKTHGSILFRIHRDEGFPEGLITEFRATVNVNTVLTAELGYSPDNLCFKQDLAGKNQYVCSYCADWSDIIDRSATDLILKITLLSGLHKTEYNAPERNSICEFIARVPRVEKSGHCDGSAFTFDELRQLHRLSERREDARRMLQTVEHDSETERLFSCGHYQTVYELLTNSLPELLPADFILYNEGPIGS